MRNILNSNVKNIEMSGIRKIANKVDRSPDVINLTFGQPNFDTPDYIKEAAIKAIQDGHTSYTETSGLLELRHAACDYVERLYNVKYNPIEEVLVTVGASEALDIAFRTILSPGDEVIIPTPVYPGYEPLIKMCGSKSVYVNTEPYNFKLTAEVIKKYITNKTKAIVLPYPNNPMGSLLTEQEVRDIANLIVNKEIFLISDEIYSELNFSNKHFSVASIPEVKNQTILINGLSKSHAMTGWRIGFVYAPKYMMDEFFKIKSFNTVCSPSISQYAALEALTNEKSDHSVLEMKKSYKERRDFVYKRLQEIGLETLLPEGAFYIFPSIVKTGLTSMEFIDRLLEQENVAVIPGSAFTEHGEGYIRISYAQSMETLIKGMDGIEKFVKSLEVNNG